MLYIKIFFLMLNFLLVFAFGVLAVKIFKGRKKTSKELLQMRYKKLIILTLSFLISTWFNYVLLELDKYGHISASTGLVIFIGIITKIWHAFVGLISIKLWIKRLESEEKEHQ